MRKTYPHGAQLAKAIGREIKIERQEKKYTQEQLAAIVDIDRATIGFFETGSANPSIMTFLAIAAALDVPANKIIENAINDFERRHEKKVRDVFGVTDAHVARQLASLKRRKVAGVKKAKK